MEELNIYVVKLKTIILVYSTKEHTDTEEKNISVVVKPRFRVGLTDTEVELNYVDVSAIKVNFSIKPQDLSVPKPPVP